MVLPKTDLSAVLPTGYGKSLIYQLLICFLADGLNIFPQALATDLACEQALHLGHTQYLFWARFIWVSREIWARAARGLGRGRGTSLQYAFFLDHLLAFPNVRRSSNFKIYFLAQNNKEVA